jgi:hypothetical protein
LSVDLRTGEIRTIVWATGFRPELSWLDVPVLDRKGQVIHDGGVTAAPGLYLIGMPFLRRRKSSLIDGAAADASDLTSHLAGYLDRLVAGPVDRPAPRADRWPTGRQVDGIVVQQHPLACSIAAAVACRDGGRLAAALTSTVRLRALLPGGPIESHGRENVVARFGGWFADFDTVELVESAGETVADRLLIHYRLSLGQGLTRWVCTQTAVCKVNGGRLAVIDLLCSGFRKIGETEDDNAQSRSRLVG